MDFHCRWGQVRFKRFVQTWIVSVNLFIFEPDTDWRVGSGELTGSQAITIFEDLMRNGTMFNTGYDIICLNSSLLIQRSDRFITLQHDLFEITVDLAVGYTLDAALSHDPKFVVCQVICDMALPGLNLLSSYNPLVNVWECPPDPFIMKPKRIPLPQV